MIPIGRADFVAGVFSEQCSKAQDRFILEEGKNSLLAFVLDGHGQNPYAAEFLQRNLKGALDEIVCSQAPAETAAEVREKILQLDEAFNKHFKTKAGCTLCGVILCDNELYVINIGDSRCIAEHKVRGLQQITVDHSLDNKEEVQRVLELGGEIQEDRFFPPKVAFWSFLMTRSFGNGFAKEQPGMSVEPDIWHFSLADGKDGDFVRQEMSPISSFTCGSGCFNWILICTDGLLVLTNQQIAGIIAHQVQKAHQKGELDAANPYLICYHLVEQCISEKAHMEYADDITCILLLNEAFVSRTTVEVCYAFQRIRPPLSNGQQEDLKLIIQRFLLELNENYQKYRQINKLKDIMAGKAQGDMNIYFCCLCEPELEYARLCKVFLECERLALSHESTNSRIVGPRKRIYSVGPSE